MSQYQKNTDTLIKEPIKLKVCGMNLNTTEVGALKPDYLGFIFWEPSKRSYNGEPVIIPHKIKKVGVFVDSGLDEVLEKVKTHQLLGVQLHGKESPAFCRQLKTNLPNIELIKVFSINNDFDFGILEPFEEVCDFFLFDTKGRLPGGNGYKFDWEVLKDYPSTKPFFLSGGIGLADIDSIKEFLQKSVSRYCHAIDVNSKFELEPGLKDTEKLKNFIKKLK